LNSSSSFWGVFFTKFQPEKCELYKLQTIFHEESGPNILDFGGEKNPYHQTDGWIFFFQNFDICCKAKGSQKKNISR